MRISPPARITAATYWPRIGFVSALDPLSDEQREIRGLVRALARERVAPRAAEIDASGEFPWDMVELLRENDLFGVMFDEEYGGIGESSLLTFVVIEELSKVCAPVERTLSEQPFLAGDAPAYVDYIIFSVFQQARIGSPRDVLHLAPGMESTRAWRSRMVALHGGLGDRFAGYPMEDT